TELIDKLDQHWNRPPAPPTAPAKGYTAEDLHVLFGRDS
ncbi:MAG: site-specific integrase, partial [Mycolicibacterium mageritense]